jgi:hypothetical protein
MAEENVVHLHERELREREARIEQAEKSYQIMGRELAAINTSQLYRDQYPTFEEYCIKRWELAGRRAYQLIDAATFAEKLNNCSVLPPIRESHIRPLLILAEADRLTVWGGVLAQAGNDPRQINATMVQAAVDRFQPTTARTTKTGKPRKPRTPKMTTTTTAPATGTTGTGQTATNPLGREPHAPGTTPHVADAAKPEPAPEPEATDTAEPEPETATGTRRKTAAPKTDAAREAVRALLLAGKPINREEIAARCGSTVHGVQLAQWSEEGKLEGYATGHAAGLEDAIANGSVLSASAQQKLDAHINRETRRLAAEHAARMAQIEEDIRLAVVAQGKAYGEEMLALSKKARETEAQWRRLIDRHHHLFTVEEYKAIRRCLHPDTLDQNGERNVTPERLAIAFNLFKEKKFLLTGQEED